MKKAGLPRFDINGERIVLDSGRKPDFLFVVLVESIESSFFRETEIW